MSAREAVRFVSVSQPYAGAWLNAALEPLGGRGGGKPTFAQGSAKGDDASAVVAAARAFAA